MNSNLILLDFLFYLPNCLHNILGHEVEDDFFDDYIEPEDYLPKRLQTSEAPKENEEMVKGEKEKITEQDTEKRPSTTTEGSFLGEVEEMTESSVRSDLAEDVSAENLLQLKNNDKGQGSLDEPCSSNNDSINQVICNRLEIETQNSPLYFGKVF